MARCPDCGSTKPQQPYAFEVRTRENQRERARPTILVHAVVEDETGVAWLCVEGFYAVGISANGEVVRCDQTSFLGHPMMVPALFADDGRIPLAVKG